MSFESANRALGDVFTGSNFECEIICRRILQRHRLGNVQIHNPSLQSVFSHLLRIDTPDEESFSQATFETDAVKEARLQYSDATILNRQIFKGVYFDSAAYGHSKQGNCFVMISENQKNTFGKIQYFVKIPAAPFYNEVQACVLMYKVLEDVGFVKGFFFRVQETSTENLVPIEFLKKVFSYKKIVNDANTTDFMVKLCSAFEHS